MKTVFINCSPKKRFCASAYFIMLLRMFTGGKQVSEKLRSPADHARILEQLRDADTAVFSLPLYVDSVPSHVLRFMEEMENFCRNNDLHLNIYAVANNGFIEGSQNEPLLQVFEHFCTHSGNNWMGGVGIGGGVMLNVTRIVFVVQIAVLLLNMLISFINTGNPFPVEAIRSFAENALLLLFFNCGVLLYLLQMGRAIRLKTSCGKRYTRIMIPSFIFILFADIFFIIISTFEGGIFRGWLARKKPDNQ